MDVSLSGVLGFILFLSLIALVPAAIANSKGRNFFVWWLYGLGFWIIALIHSMLLSPLRTCPHCAETIKPEAKVCPHCQREITASTTPTSNGDCKPCPNCGDPVLFNAKICRWCTTPIGQ